MVYNQHQAKRSCKAINEGHTMTKSEIRDVSKTIGYAAALGPGRGPDYMARALSALYRSARSAKSQREILAVAMSYGAISHDEFIIGR